MTERRRAAVLGHPVSHSLSPRLHRAAYRHLGLDWEYDARDVVRDALPGFIDSCGPEWVGLSLTMPLKRDVVPLLDTVDDTVALVGAANTVVFTPSGRHGANTDVPGLIAALDERLVVPVEEATILGGGATAASALAALVRWGAVRVQVFVRTPDAGSDLSRLARDLGVAVEVSAWADAQQGLLAPLVISTVPWGATDHLAHAAPTLAGTLFDVVYEPWPTALAAQWASRGGVVVSGHDLLVHQAALQVQLMTGHAVPVEVLRAALATT